MEILENYLSIEKIRFQNRLTIEFDIPKDLRNYQVLPFSLQILAENAVKHGIGKQKNGGIVKTTVEKVDKNLILKVSNTGNLKSSLDFSKENTGIGLENLRKRLKINFGEKATFEIQELNNLVTAIISIPLEI
jgi:LytS/YehU family sensor histidine kinase